jgi:hypothetical protein
MTRTNGRHLFAIVIFPGDYIDLSQLRALNYDTDPERAHTPPPCQSGSG